MKQKLLSASAVAGILGFSRASVGEWARLGRIESVYTPGHRRMFRSADIQALAETLGVAEPKETAQC